ncbi:MAG: flagellar protein FlgN [Proteobacteria bacterium]|nr:flagellar protein FlgN [Pseudomonadota bacterium]
MKAALDELMNLLETHLSLYGQLAGLLDREQAALLELDVVGLQKMAKTKETLSLKIRLHLPALTESIRSTARALGLPESPLPVLAQMASAAPEPWANRLNRASLALARLKREVGRHNEINRHFVQESLDMIAGHLSILTGAATKSRESGYQSNGQRTAGPSYGPVKLNREV